MIWNIPSNYKWNIFQFSDVMLGFWLGHVDHDISIRLCKNGRIWGMGLLSVSPMHLKPAVPTGSNS